ncbi:MAG: hypothetical protein AAF962_01565 [Actinomycetota bacterium]
MVNRRVAGPIPIPGPAPATPPPAAPAEPESEGVPPAESEAPAPAPARGLGLFDDDRHSAGLAPVVVPPSHPAPAPPTGPLGRLVDELGLGELVAGDDDAPTVLGIPQVVLLGVAVALAVAALVFSFASMGASGGGEPAPTTPVATTTLPALAPGDG